MSFHEDARKLIDQAQGAIQSANPQYATELLRQAIFYNGKDPDAYLLLGIALGQMRMPADAENAFKKAIRLDPNHLKARYNLAVLQYTEGQMRAALESAREAAAIDARHGGSRDLIAKIESELGLEPGELPKTTPAGNPTPAPYREGYEPQEVRTMRFIDGLGFYWTGIGWTIAFASFMGLLITLILVRPYLGADLKADALVHAVNSGALAAPARALFFGSLLVGMVWTALDAIHRNGNLLWLLPQVVCGCTGFTWVVVPIYILFGRKSTGNV